MKKLLDSMGKMIGPLPLGAWLLAIGLGVGIIVYNNKNNGKSSYVDESFVARDTSSDPGVGVGGSGMWTQLNPPTTSTNNDSAISSNSEWGKLALVRAIGLGYTPIQADSAIRAYLASEQMSTADWAIINDLLRVLGPVPEPLGPSENKPPVIKPPTAGTGSTPSVTTSYISHVVRYGQTLAAIANAYGVTWATLYNANKIGFKRADGSMGVIANTAYIPPGTRLVVPGVSGATKRLPITYTVRAGDTISSIATKIGVRWADVYDNNKAKIPNTAKLKVGTVLVIP